MHSDVLVQIIDIGVEGLETGSRERIVTIHFRVQTPCCARTAKFLKAADMRAKLKSYPDFGNSKTLLEELIESRGHICVYYPKYYCELSPIELVWCQAKKAYSCLC